jgi:catechol 2,3-dioxygenase-like lactoylglutathione lyase family enzyme
MSSNYAITPELKVSDFAESLSFYTALAGFTVLYTRPENDFAMLTINGAHLMIEGITGKTRTWATAELQKPFGRGMNLQIKVDDVNGLYNKFVAANWPIHLGMEEKWYRMNDTAIGHKQFLVQDPDGYLLRFFQDLGTQSISLPLL